MVVGDSNCSNSKDTNILPSSGYVYMYTIYSLTLILHGMMLYLDVVCVCHRLVIEHSKAVIVVFRD